RTLGAAEQLGRANHRAQHVRALRFKRDCRNHARLAFDHDVSDPGELDDRRQIGRTQRGSLSGRQGVHQATVSLMVAPLPDYALVVGISRYPGISDLSGPENDANDFFAWVTSKEGGGVGPANAKLILSSGFQPAQYTQDERPAQDQIYDFFNWMDNLA